MAVRLAPDLGGARRIGLLEVTSTPSIRPTVLLGGLDPIFEVGIARALGEGGAEVISDAHRGADGLVLQATDSHPDAIVLGDGPDCTPDLGARLRAAAPSATIVLWRSDATTVALIAPGAEAPRMMPAPTADQLLVELFGYSEKGASCPST
jgi:hypothetical protein